jgi:hypothetical protein
MPIPGQPFVVSPTLLADCQAYFMDAYASTQNPYQEVIDSCSDVVPMETRQDRYAYWESPPNPRRWSPGESIPQGSMVQKSYVMPLVNWGLKVIYSRWDAEDEVIKSIPNAMAQLASRYKLLKPRVLAQILEGSTNPALLGTVGNAVDEVALFSATDAQSLDRFNVSGGNIVSSASSTSAPLIYKALWEAHSAFMQFYGTDRINPLLDPSEYSELTVLYHPTRNRYFREAFEQQLRGEVVVTDIAAAGVDNLLSKMGNLKIKLVSFNYLTDPADWYVVASKARVKPILFGTKKEMTDMLYTRQNSENAGDNAYEAYNTDERWGARPHFAFSIVKVNV